MVDVPGSDEAAQALKPCTFCELPETRIIWSSPLAVGTWDAYPVSPGHALVIPRRHVPRWDDLTPDEKTALLEGTDAVRTLITDRCRPDGYNVGFNDGQAAGQTVMHFHVHVIPRYARDVDDPRGGLRWVLPDKADYWTRGDR